MASYDPSIIQKYANRLYSNANAIIVLSALMTGLVGAGFGAVGGYALEAGLLGAVLGVLIGTSLAFNLKLKAQLALCQMRIESNTAQLLARGVPAGMPQPPPPPRPSTPVARPPST